MLQIFQLSIYIVLGILALLQFVSFIQDIITTTKKDNHRKKVESTNIELLGNRPETRTGIKFEHWKKYVEPQYVNYGQEHQGVWIPYYSIVKYPPDWNMRKLYISEVYENKCAICSKYDKLGHTHHINPLSRGGNNNLENLVYLCRYCHEDQHWHLKLRKDKRRKEAEKLGINEEDYLRERREKYLQNKKINPINNLKSEKHTNAELEKIAEEIFGK
jgi:hypothetical protein